MKTFSYANPEVLEKPEKTTALREHYIDRHEVVTLHFNMDCDEGYELFNDMPAHTLPLLPAGYQWVSFDGKYSLIREKTVPEQKFLIVIYGPNKNKIPRINYIMQIDGVTAYSFAHTKNGEEPKRRYPMSKGSYCVPGFNYQAARYKKEHVKGHLIDHKDTIMTTSSVDWSTYDARNYIPEPPEYEWGLGLRRLAVKKIRDRGDGGAYAQLTCYSDNPKITVNGTKVPDFVYFYPYRVDQYDYIKENPYNVEWLEKLSRPKGKKVLEHAEINFTTSVDAAPVVVPYDVRSPDRAFRYEGRQKLKKTQQIETGDVVSRFKGKDGLFANCDTGDMEFEGSSRKIFAALFADERQDKKNLSKKYIERSAKFGEGLIELDEKNVTIISTEAEKAIKPFFTKHEEDPELDDLADIFRKLMAEQPLKKPL